MLYGLERATRWRRQPRFSFPLSIGRWTNVKCLVRTLTGRERLLSWSSRPLTGFGEKQTRDWEWKHFIPYIGVLLIRASGPTAL